MTINLTLLGAHIPAEWSLVPVNGRKRPVDPVTGMGLKGWQNSSINLTTFPFASSHVQAIGVLAGSKSNGLLVVDIDSGEGIGLLEKLTGRSVCDFPKTISCTSGKPGTQKLFYRVPNEDHWSGLRSAHLPGLDILWDGCQAVVAGKHPTTGSYKWLDGCAPDQIQVEDAPDWLLTALVQHLKKPTRSVKARSASVFPTKIRKHGIKGHRSSPNDHNRDADVARQALKKLDPTMHEGYADWLKVGMCLHSVTHELLEDWIDWSSHMSNFDEHECNLKWQSFTDCDAFLEKTGRPGLGLGTLLTLGTQATLPQDSSESLKAIQDKQNGNLAMLQYLRTLDIRFNDLKRRVEINGEILQQDPKYFYLKFAEMTGLNVNRELARDALMTVAHENSFNPVAEYLESVLPLADQTPPIADEEIASWFGFSPEDNVSVELTRIHLRACAMRGMKPGSKMDSVLILSGPMGLRKSTAVKSLAPDSGWYDETTRLDIDNKDTLSSMNSAWIFELSEIEKLTSTRDSSVLKAWVTRSSDKYVEKYETVTTEHPRRTCLWGTTNAGTFLNDPTGSRRYWITFVEATCKIDSLIENRDRLWAHSLSEVMRALPCYLDPTDDLMVQANDRGSNATFIDPWQEKLQKVLKKSKSGDFLSTQNLFALIDRDTPWNYQDLSELQTLGVHNLLDTRRLAGAMNALGWKSHRKTTERGYIKI